MTRRMLINAQTREELRVAIVDGTTLEDFQVEVAERGSTRGNIYRGTIAKIEPSLNAAFIDYGAERHGFLPIQDVVAQAYYKQPPKGEKRPRIEHVLERGKPIVVQVSKDPEANKGAALTTNLSLAGRYLVLTPFDDTRGVSRKVEDDDTRKRLKDQVRKLEVPDGCGVIVRTNALDQNKTTLMRDLSALLRLWKRIGTEARQGKGVSLIYSDQDLILQALRDYLDPDIQEILVDEDGAYSRAEEYMKAYMPRGGNRLLRYEEREPLFSRYGLEPQIDRIYERRVFLPSGGSIVIDRTEALTAIDVNSGRSTGASSQEQTAVDTNLQAAVEVARQLRLRDIGGLVVVDFIDMRANRNQRKVEKALRDAMKADKARSTVSRISDNGLLEINRQRVHQALALRTHRTCPTCDGTGRVPSPEMVGLNLLRRIKGRAATAPLARVRIALHPELAEAFQNARRRDILQLENEFDLKVEVVASSRLNLREQEVEWEKREGGDNRPATPVVRTASIKVGDEALAPSEDDAASGNGAPSGRRRRSRRSSRRRSGDGETQTDAKSDGKKQEIAGGKSASDAGSDADGDKPRRRSRRRRSSSAGDDGGAEAKAERTQKDTKGEAAQEDSGKSDGGRPSRRRSSSRRKSADDDTPAQDGDTPSSGRRRSRRRSGTTTTDSSTEKSAAKAPSDDGAESGGGGTRRRRRRRSEPADDDGSGDRRSSRSASSTGSKSRSSSGTASSSSAAEGGEKRSRRRSSGRSSAAASGDGSGNDAGGDKSSDGDRPRPRRRRRSSRRSAEQES